MVAAASSWLYAMLCGCGAAHSMCCSLVMLLVVWVVGSFQLCGASHLLLGWGLRVPWQPRADCSRRLSAAMHGWEGCVCPCRLVLCVGTQWWIIVIAVLFALHPSCSSSAANWCLSQWYSQWGRRPIWAVVFVTALLCCACSLASFCVVATYFSWFGLVCCSAGYALAGCGSSAAAL